MYGHQEKALWITGKACIDYPGNPDLLDNYAAFLIMAGAEHAAIPILLYLNNKFPNNSTILNNLGQAWFGLGDIAISKKYLETATELYPTHSMANLTLSKIYLAEPPDTTKAMAALKNSIRESYCADKEQSLTGIGGALTLDDLPEFDYPIEKNSYQLENLFKAIPDFQSSLDEYANSDALWRGFENAKKEVCEQARIDAAAAEKEQAEFVKKMAEDIPYQQGILYSYDNSPSHALAKRYLSLLTADEASGQNGSSYYRVKNDIPGILASFLPGSYYRKSSEKKAFIDFAIIRALDKVMEDELIKPAEALEVERKKNIARSKNCSEADAINSEFLSKANSIQVSFKDKFYQKYLELKSPFDEYISMIGYAAITGSVADDPARAVITYFGRVVQPNNAELIGKKPYEFRQQFSVFLDSYNQLTNHRVSADRCSSPSREKPPTQVQLPQLKQPECPNKIEINLLGIRIAFEWGRMICDESKLKKLKSGETKGSAVSSKKQSSSPPVSLDGILNGHGPSTEITQKIKDISYDGPLITGISDEPDTTKRYIEFDKYGNLTDLKIPLNKEGTGFADSYSVETFDQRRWCWVACASGREKILDGLFKK